MLSKSMNELETKLILDTQKIVAEYLEIYEKDLFPITNSIQDNLEILLDKTNRIMEEINAK